MLVLIGVIVGCILTLLGGLWLYFNTLLRGVNEVEVECMEREGKFPGEPDYMQDFRVARSEWDLQTSDRNRYLAIIVMIAGIIIIALSLLKGLG